MAKTNIEWTTKVWNPTTGCTKISQGCKNCYAEKMHKRLQAMGLKKYSRNFNEGAFLDSESLTLPLKTKKPTTFFVNSMSDLFHEKLSFHDIAKVYSIMFLAPQHTFQVLTKRDDVRLLAINHPSFIQLIKIYANKLAKTINSKTEITLLDVYNNFPLKNVWEGVSIENKETIHRADNLRNTPAAIRWISAEPLLEDISEIDLTGIDWLVVGGESGPSHRPFNPDWARVLLDKCKATGTKFFMKQIDKKQSIPDDLMVREYPEYKKQILA